MYCSSYRQNNSDWVKVFLYLMILLQFICPSQTFTFPYPMNLKQKQQPHRYSITATKTTIIPESTLHITQRYLSFETRRYNHSNNNKQQPFVSWYTDNNCKSIIDDKEDSSTQQNMISRRSYLRDVIHNSLFISTILLSTGTEVVNAVNENIVTTDPFASFDEKLAQTLKPPVSQLLDNNNNNIINNKNQQPNKAKVWPYTASPLPPASSTGTDDDDDDDDLEDEEKILPSDLEQTLLNAKKNKRQIDPRTHG